MNAARVLVIDDDDDIRGLVVELLQRAGLTVEQAPDGRAGLRAFHQSPADLVVLDVSMPGKTGIDLSRLIRADPRVSGIRVILLSAAVDESAQRVGLDAGADEYFTKPFSPRDLIRRLTDVAVEIRGQS